MPTITNYPEELANTGTLTFLGASIDTSVDSHKADLKVISHSAREIVSVAQGLVAIAQQDYAKALGFIGLPMMGAYQLGYERALKDMGLMGRAD